MYFFLISKKSKISKEKSMGNSQKCQVWFCFTALGYISVLTWKGIKQVHVGAVLQWQRLTCLPMGRRSPLQGFPVSSRGISLSASEAGACISRLCAHLKVCAACSYLFLGLNIRNKIGMIEAVVLGLKKSSVKFKMRENCLLLVVFQGAYLFTILPALHVAKCSKQRLR